MDKKIPKNYRNTILSIFLLTAITFSIIRIVTATTPDPGHNFTEISGGLILGDLIYGSGADTATALAGNITITKKFLNQTGNGSVSATPVWSALTNADVGLGNVENTALSTWAGSANITTVGTISTGVWSGTAIDHTKLTGIVQADVGGLTTASVPSFAGETLTGNLTLSTHDLVTDITTGTKIGTATTQKLGFFNATPVIQQTGNALTALSTLGLVASPTLTSANVGLGNVENTALSTWAGSANITTVGALASGSIASGFGSITTGNTVSAPTHTGSGAVTVSSGGSSGLTLDSASGRTTLATGDFLSTGVAGVTGAAAGDIWYDSTAAKYKINEAGATKTLCNLTDLGCGAGGTGVSLAPASADSDSSVNPSIFINDTGGGNLLQLRTSGLDKFVVANSGGLSIFAATTDIVKTTTGTTRTQDFSITGSTLQNVTSLNDLISIDNGTITLEGSIAASSPAVTTAAAMGLGGQVILRDDGKYIIIHGGGATGVSIWDGSTTGAMSAAPTILTNAAGAGAIALRRPDGRYLVVSGNSSAGLTTLYDPYGITASAAGAVVCAAGAVTTGTNAILLPSGNYLIMCGGLAVTSIYNPTSNVVTVGPPLPTGTFGVGAHALVRDDGTFLIFKGNGAGTAIYKPNNSGTGVTTIGTMTDVTITNAPTIAIGATSIRRQDGTYLVIPGAITTSAIYDPKGTTASPNGTFTSQSGAGNGPSAVLGEGAQAIWRQDGNYLLIIGGATVVTTNVVKPGAAAGSQFVTTNAPSLSAGGAGVGITAFMRPNGTYAILKGNGTAVDYYDMQFVIGGNSTGTGALAAYYESECIDNANINANSVINWNSNSEGTLAVEQRTVTSPAACTTGTYATSTKSGDLIRPTATTDNRIQFRVTFKRDMPKFFDQEWGIRKNGLTRYRRTNKDPALYDISAANGLALHRTQFDFGDSTATSGPVSINITNNKDKQLGIALEAGVGYGSTVGTAVGSGGIYNGAFTSNPALTTTATNGTIVMKRPDGKFVVISGNTATANAQLYNPDSRTFTALGTTPAAGTGLGALAFKRPDGKFLIVLGNNTNVTSIFNPVTNTFTAGPALTGLAGDGAQVIPLPNGRVLIIHGNYLSTTSIYDPLQNIMIGGPVPSTVVGQGSIVIPRPDGTFLFIPGTITTGCTALNAATNIFDPYTMIFGAIAAPTLTGTGPGAFAFQRNDGLWVIVRGGSTITTCVGTTATHIYNPISNRIVAGPVLSASAQRGGHAIPRPDGTWVIVHGNALTTTSIYREDAGAYSTDAGGPIGLFVAGPTLVTAAGAGSISFQKDNGKIVTITGNANTVAQEYDAGWVDKGTYKTEQFNLGTQLGTDSTLAWRANTFTGISAEVKTATTQAGLQTAATREVAKSGALINPGGSDTWLQINFNFIRKFPSYDRLYTDTWYNSSGSFSYAQRKIETPILFEYRVTKDKDVIDLQSNGLSVFRVNSAGDVYTQAGGTINTSGADLAERYASQEELQKGEVVSIDPQNNHGVKKTLYQYQPDVLGVVSTDPGFVAGAYTKDSYPIALIGRVPVKVSTENGMIQSGDSLTAASVPGHAMKARLAGRVIGKALESLDAEKLEECPASDFIIPGRKCGIIMMFVNLIDYSGQPVELAMAEASIRHSEALALEQTIAPSEQQTTPTSLEVPVDIEGLAIAEPKQEQALSQSTTTQISSEDQVAKNRENILAFLRDLKEEKASFGISSEIFTDRISAAFEIISPQITTDSLVAKEIRVEGQTVLQGGLRIDRLGDQGDMIQLLADVTFFGRPYFTADTAGFALIQKGERRVSIAFEREYLDQPIVNVMLTQDTDLRITASSTADELQEIDRQEQSAVNNLFAEDVRFIVTKKSAKGFTIVLNKSAPTDIQFSWIALTVRNAKTFFSLREASSTPAILAPEPIAPASSTPTISPPEQETTPASVETVFPTASSAPATFTLKPEILPTPVVTPQETPASPPGTGEARPTELDSMPVPSDIPPPSPDILSTPESTPETTTIPEAPTASESSTP